MRIKEKPFAAPLIFLCFFLAFVLTALQETKRLDSFIRQLPFKNAETGADAVAAVSRFSGMAALASAETALARQAEKFSVSLTGVTAPDANVPDVQAAEIPAAAASDSWFPLNKEIKVLIAGDSMIADYLGAELQRRISARPEVQTVVRDGRYSTGLSKDDYFDWPAHMALLLKEHKPDLVIVCLGGNDAQDIVENGKRYYAGTADWNLSYRKRAEDLVRAATADGARLIWLGLPVVGNEKFAPYYKTIVFLQEFACNMPGGDDNFALAKFIDNWTVLADPDGSYNSYRLTEKGRVRVRTSDRIHVNQAGAEILGEYDLARIYEAIELPAVAAAAEAEQAD
ncbi:MAG: DUF459 domain-containing protein [Treponema sp.]|jgi:hypothetical protein|nr:DUF459 domain-containing protein [Treponema sp.]